MKSHMVIHNTAVPKWNLWNLWNLRTNFFCSHWDQCKSVET